MFRPTASLAVIALLSVSSLSVVACDKPGVTEQQKEDKARQQADNTTNNAQAQAEQDIASARAQFEKVREDYRHSRRLDLADLDKKIVDIDARSRTATGDKRADLTARVTSLRAQRDTFVRDMQALDTATGATWDTAKADLDHEWDALKSAVDKAT
jgi:hypothetical protein